MLNRFVGVFALVVSGVSFAGAQIVVNTTTKTGDTISGDHRFRVTVQSQSLVSQVEFYINDNLVATDESTPYEFVLDTLLQNDGPIKVTVAAYNSAGESKKVDLNIRVDNGMSLGVKHHVDIAEAALTVGNWDAAIAAGRVAVKINPNDNTARMVMARAYFGKGVFDLAQKFAEDAVASDSSNIAAKELLAGISLRQAFRALTLAGDRDRTLDTVSSALKSAARSRRDSMNEQMDKFGPVTDANRFRYVDLLNQAGRFSLAIDIMAPRFEANEVDSAVANRLIYSQLRAGRYTDASKTMARHTRRGEPDAYGFALKAVIENWTGNDRASAEAEREALLYDPSNMGVRTAQAFLSLRRGNPSTFASITGSLAESAGSSPITNYYLTALNFMQGQFSSSDATFQAGLLADPGNYHIYLEKFNQTISYLYSQNLQGDDKRYQLAFAKAFAEGALEAKPESFEALTALTVHALIEEKWADAIRLGQAAVAAGPEYGAANYALAGAYFGGGNTAEGTKVMANAAKYDKYLDGIRAPKPDEAWRFFYRYGRTPLLFPPTS
jgi:tetratricopeptide (TPR) repeat protein